MHNGTVAVILFDIQRFPAYRSLCFLNFFILTADKIINNYATLTVVQHVICKSSSD